MPQSYNLVIDGRTAQANRYIDVTNPANGTVFAHCPAATEADLFMQQMLHNKMLLLTVLLAVGAAVYFGIGLFMLLRY